MKKMVPFANLFKCSLPEISMKIVQSFLISVTYIYKMLRQMISLFLARELSNSDN